MMATYMLFHFLEVRYTEYFLLHNEMPAAKEHIGNIKMQAIATLDPVKKE
jgi:hypothetical protein